MKRRLFPILSALSLLLCVAVVVLWVASRLRTVGVARYHRPHDGDAVTTTIVEFRAGRFELQRDVFERGGEVNDDWDVYWHRPSPNDNFGSIHDVYGWISMGFMWLSQEAHDWSKWRLSIPCYVPAAVTALPPFLWIVRKKRTRPGLCPACGYDLRATPEQCPECGTASAKAPA